MWLIVVLFLFIELFLIFMDFILGLIKELNVYYGN